MLITICGIIIFVSIIFWERQFYNVDIPIYDHVKLVAKHISSVSAVVFTIVFMGYFFDLDRDFIFLLVISVGALSWLYFDFYFSRNRVWDSQK